MKYLIPLLFIGVVYADCQQAEQDLQDFEKAAHAHPPEDYKQLVLVMDLRERATIDRNRQCQAPGAEHENIIVSNYAN